MLPLPSTFRRAEGSIEAGRNEDVRDGNVLLSFQKRRAHGS